MIINPDSVDKYVAKKGLVPLLTDAQWNEALRHIANALGNDLWHRCRLVNQTDEPLARYSTVFPNAVPKPYRHIRYLEVLASDSQRLDGVVRWLTEHGVQWQICREDSPEADQDRVVTLQVFGFAANLSG